MWSTFSLPLLLSPWECLIPYNCKLFALRKDNRNYLFTKGYPFLETISVKTNDLLNRNN